MQDPNVNWVKINRSMFNWEWYKDIPVKVLFLHMILRANNKDRKVRGETIKRGQFWTSVSILSSETGLSIKQVRTAIKKMEKTNEISVKGASKGTIVTICNYDVYQYQSKLEGQAKGKIGASEGQAKGDKQDYKTLRGKDYQDLRYKKEEKNSPTPNKESQEQLEHPLSGKDKEAGEVDVATSIENSYHPDVELNNAISLFVKHRNGIKAPMSKTSLDALISTLKTLSKSKALEAIQKAVIGGYKSLDLSNTRSHEPQKVKPNQKQFNGAVPGDKLRNADYSEGL